MKRLLMLVMLMVAVTTGCGKKGDLRAPELAVLGYSEAAIWGTASRA